MPNLRCTGLLTVAPSLGSSKNTRGLAAEAAGLGDSLDPHALKVMTAASSARWLMNFIGISPCVSIEKTAVFWSPTRLSATSTAPPTEPPTTALAQTTGCRVQHEHAVGDRGRKRAVAGDGDDGRSSLFGEIAESNSKGS